MIILKDYMAHEHEWIKTGTAYYSFPIQYEFKCQCGKKKLVEDKHQAAFLKLYKPKRPGE